MNFRTCSRQPEVLDLLARGHWPHACPTELRSHLAECPSCANMLLVTQAFQRSRADAVATAQLPAPGTIWWRAQLRRRSAAVERVGKPIFGAYVFAMGIAVLVAAVAVISQAHHGVRWLNWLAHSQFDALHLQSFNPFTALNPGWTLAVLIPIFAMLALLGAVAVYLAAERQ
jgi:hypothetical protein